jgi:hypothetical protein
VVDSEHSIADAPRLLGGRSALFWAKRQTNSLIGAMLCLPFMVAGSQLDALARQIVVLMALAGLLALAARAAHAGIRLSPAARQERAAGYTTLSSRRYQDLWQLDPHTGAVVRRPNAARD